MQIDSDVLAFFKGQGVDLQDQVNAMLRFVKDDSEAREQAFAAEGFEPGEMTIAPPGIEPF